FPSNSLDNLPVLVERSLGPNLRQGRPSYPLWPATSLVARCVICAKAKGREPFPVISRSSWVDASFRVDPCIKKIVNTKLDASLRAVIAITIRRMAPRRPTEDPFLRGERAAPRK